MKEEFEGEYEEVLSEEIQDEAVDIIEELTDEEEQELSGGALFGSVSGGNQVNCGVYRLTTSAKMVNIASVWSKVGTQVDRVEWIQRNGAGYNATGATFWLKRGINTGLVAFRVYGHRIGGKKCSRFLTCYVTFR